VASRRCFLLAAPALLLAANMPAFARGYVDIPVSSREATNAINRVRAQNGRGPVSLNRDLFDAAEYQARLMAEHDQISHELNGERLAGRVRRAGYDGIAGENLSAGRSSVDAVVEGWMNSSGHRRNMLDSRFTEFGLAAAQVPGGQPSRYRNYWALILGAQTGGGTVLPSAPGVSIGGGGGGISFSIGRRFRFTFGG
jgi:uncharacterized protein YkwD